jgi:Flp pilus assembly protein TadB
MKLFDSSDPWSSVIILLTFVLFGFALFVHGFTHNLLLESGVFLVSLKLILMARKNTENARRLERHMEKLEEMLTRQEEIRNSEDR